MNPDTATEDIYEERIARYLELAEAAQDAACRAPDGHLHDTYVYLAGRWMELADLARGTVDLARRASMPLSGNARETRATN